MDRRSQFRAPLVAAAATVSLLVPAGASAAGGADLKTKRPQLRDSSVVQGESFKAREITVNTGGRKVARTSTSLALSRNRRADGEDTVVGTHKLGPLRPGEREKDVVRLRVVRTQPPGDYWLIACADAGKRVREADEGNNCRVSRRQITVVSSG